MTDKEFEKWEQERDIGQEILDGIKDIQAGKIGTPMTQDQNTLIGGYKQLYDPCPIIEQVIRSRFDKIAWDELWNELHHQGNVGTASYAAVPLLVHGIIDRTSDYNFYGLIGTIEIQRHQSNNPPLPNWLKKDYIDALKKCFSFAEEDYGKSNLNEVTQLILGFLALQKEDIQLANILLGFSRVELLSIVEEYSDPLK